MRKISKRINDSDFIGKTFNLLTVISTEEVTGTGKHRKAVCKCNCGNEVRVTFYDLRRGHTKSCGCHRSKTTTERSTKHGMARHPLTPIYSAMIDRCGNPRHKRYSDYGGRGIKVCQEWLDSNTAFFAWALSNGWRHGLDIDRRDNDKGYSPENCRCVTRLVNNRNKRNSRLTTQI